ncbi:ABC transporter ATP-binding protein [Tropicimonas sp. IMCC34043]|uniref:ABC transporter ATP-binding protein n=1 Tax=Tropicimonas sp. IMCC34043 TaxID=2248760 RepID=UPI000E277C31|nr:ABC transporter ATP-binding protein [Tropicimonas sp. IMCC34043]
MRPDQGPDQATETEPATLLEVRGLTTCFKTGFDGREINAIEEVSFSVAPGETLAIVGESGSGKSVTSLSVMGLLPPQTGRIAAGSIRFRGRELTTLDNTAMRGLRGNMMSMIFQEPMTSFNPVYTIGHQIAEVIVLHQKLGYRLALRKAVEMLELVGIPEARRRVDNFPHQMSGGMRQRAMIAMALSCEPDLLIADEPTTALDVTIQAQVLELLKDLQARMGMAMIFITHDLGVVAEVADRVCVMYAGQIVETAPVNDIFAAPRMPYTAALLGSMPRLGAGRDRLVPIPGHVPPLSRLPKGCRFRGRCSFARPECAAGEPTLDRIEPGHDVRCFRVGEPDLLQRSAS